jgi:methylated-DNA-[protein]-cysteine S-methyltransferase
MFDVVIGFPKMKVAVATREARVVEIRFLPPGASEVFPTSALAERAARQLERYRDDPDAKFDLPVVVEGSPLQRAVWDAMGAIPRGKTRTYGDIARELRADARDIGQACGDNRLPIVIPCHRVVAADGIGGFGHATGGYLLEVKRWLLMHEAPAFELRP